MPRDHTVKIGGDWSDGFLVGKAAALSDWAFKKEHIDGLDFRRLVWRLQAKKYWAAKNPISKARIKEYRRQWRLQHKAHCQRLTRDWKREARKDPAYRAKQAAAHRAATAIKSQKRRAELIYTCVVCGAQWCRLGRIPARPPKYCGQRCRSRANYLRAKAAGKPWTR